MTRPPAARAPTIGYACAPRCTAPSSPGQIRKRPGWDFAPGLANPTIRPAIGLVVAHARCRLASLGTSNTLPAQPAGQCTPELAFPVRWRWLAHHSQEGLPRGLQKTPLPAPMLGGWTVHRTVACPFAQVQDDVHAS